MGLQSNLFRGDPKLEAAAVSDPAHILPGALGDHVAKIQSALMQLDDAQINSADLQRAHYGPSTAQAVLNYKKQRNIVNHAYQSHADNIIGKMTIASLDQEMALLESRGDDQIKLCGREEIPHVSPFVIPPM
jgi:hypothetical protein